MLRYVMSFFFKKEGNLVLGIELQLNEKERKKRNSDLIMVYTCQKITSHTKKLKEKCGELTQVLGHEKKNLNR